MNELTVMGFPISRTGYIPKSIQAGIAIKQALAGSADAPDYWLRVIVARYLEKFYRDRKNGHPAAEDLPFAIDSWVEDIGYNLTEDGDAERVIRGFMLLSRSIVKWPQPVELLKCMPGRPGDRGDRHKGDRPVAPTKCLKTSQADPTCLKTSEALQNILDLLDSKGETDEL